MAKSIQKSLGKARPAYWLSGQTANITAAGHPLSAKSCLTGGRQQPYHNTGVASMTAMLIGLGAAALLAVAGVVLAVVRGRK